MDKPRLKRAEKAAEAAGMAEHPSRCFVYFTDTTTDAQGQDAGIMGKLDGEPFPLAEWEKIATDHDRTVHIEYVDEAPGKTAHLWEDDDEEGEP